MSRKMELLEKEIENLADELNVHKDDLFLLADTQQLTTETCSRVLNLYEKLRLLSRCPSHEQYYVDPPSGWRYGFPKVLTPGTSYEDLLKESGYPDIELALKYSRFWVE